MSCYQFLLCIYCACSGLAMVVPCPSVRVGSGLASEEAFVYSIAQVCGEVAAQRVACERWRIVSVMPFIVVCISCLLGM